MALWPRLSTPWPTGCIYLAAPSQRWYMRRKKLLLYSGGLLFLAVAAVFLQTQMAPPISQSMQESQLTQYVCTYAGPVDKEVLVQIKIDRQGAAQIYAEASEDENKALFLEYYAARCWALDELSIRYEELLDLQTAGEKGLKLVNELPLIRFTVRQVQIFDLHPPVPPC